MREDEATPFIGAGDVARTPRQEAWRWHTCRVRRRHWQVLDPDGHRQTWGWADGDMSGPRLGPNRRDKISLYFLKLLLNAKTIPVKTRKCF
jgi:hypothetical protein